MARNNIKRIESDMQLALSNIIREMKDPRISTMLSVVRVNVSGDLSYATVYISSMNGFDDAKNAVKALEKASGFVRREVSQRIDIRKSPEFRFIADDSIEYGAKLTKKLNDLNK